MPQNFKSFYKFQRDFLNDPSQLRIVTKLRQGGFTETIAFEGVKEASRESFPGEWIIYISAGQKQASAIRDRCKWWIHSEPPYGLGLSSKHLKVDSKTEIILPNQSGLVFLPSIEETIRGYPGRRIYLDELAHNKKDKSVYQAITPSISRQDVPRYLTCLSSAFGKRGTHYEIATNQGNKYPNFSRHNITIEDAIRDGYPIDRDFCRELVGDDISYRQEYMCEFLDDALSYIAFQTILDAENVDLENSSAEELSKENGYFVSAYDPAKKVDSGVFMVVEAKDKKHIIRHIKEFQKVAYHEQIDYITEFITEAHITKHITDETGVGQKIQEDINRILGSMAEGISFTNTIKEKMAADVKNELENEILEIPDNIKLKNQLHGLERGIGKSGIVTYNAASGEHDDYFWALAMALQGFSRVKDYRIISV